jgi:hypothetical protein
MNANELADLLEVDSWYKLVTREEIATMLRQQQADIAELNNVRIYMLTRIGEFKKDMANKQAEIEALKKTIESLFGGLESSLALNKAQTERNK